MKTPPGRDETTRGQGARNGLPKTLSPSPLSEDRPGARQARAETQDGFGESLPFSTLPRRRIAIVAHDLVMTPIAVAIAYYLRVGIDPVVTYHDPLSFWMGSFWAQSAGVIALLLLPVAAVIYWLFGLYRGVWRFASVPDLINIAKAVGAVALALAALGFLMQGRWEEALVGGDVIVPRTVPFIYALVQIALLAGPRLLYRAYRDRRQEKRRAKSGYRIPVLVVGSGLEAEQLIRRLRTTMVEPMIPVGLVTHKPAHVGERIQNVPVLGLYTQLDTIVADLRRGGVVPRRLIFTHEALTHGGPARQSVIDDLTGAARQLGLTVVTPAGGLQDVSEDGAEGKKGGELRLAPIAIEDLLGRPARDLDLSPVRRLVAGRRVLVTGGGGSIGSELCRQIAEMHPASLVVAENSELALYGITRELAGLDGLALDPVLCDVRDKQAVERLAARVRPDVVFHAAALKHVDIVEAHAIEGVQTNLLGTRNVADAAVAMGAEAVVFISTDKAVEPASILGASKRAGEMYCAALDARLRAEGRATRVLSVRFGNVLGSSGSVVPLFRTQLAQGGPLTVTHRDVERYFMTISEAVRLVLMAAASHPKARGNRAPASTFVLDMGTPIRIADLAAQMIRLAGYEPGRDIEIAYTGLRPGEKLSEGLSDPDETLDPSGVPGVNAVAPGDLDPQVVLDGVERVRRACAARDADEVRRALADLVPRYAPETLQEAQPLA
ncbi:MAG: nucleoside-diphosphate sugar epimerase/dehydratase [Pseudomonadota bacterium]